MTIIFSKLTYYDAMFKKLEKINYKQTVTILKDYK